MFNEGNDDYGFIWILLIFALFGFGGFNGGGRASNSATAEDVYNATNNQTYNSKLDSIANGICSSGYENAQLINGVNIQSMNNTNAITSQMNNGFYSVNENLNNLAHQLEQCCCNLRSQMLQDKYDDVRNQLNLAQITSANSVQTDNILGNIGRFVVNPPYPYYYSYGTTVQ